MRVEKDFIGKQELPKNALYGINSLRAKENFPNTTIFHKEWYQAVGIVKTACLITYKSFKNALLSKYNSKDIPINLFDDKLINTITETTKEIAKGKYYEHFIVPAIQGGAGTSINMNINEIVANASLLKFGKKPGEYNYIDPVEHVNIYQSTNDVIPTSLKVTTMLLLNKLETTINNLRQQIEIHENQNRNNLRIAYTQMQEAVPSSYGKLFSAYNDCLSRDWWRVSKCSERIKVVNLGGSAVGTGLTVPRFFIMEVVSNLQKITNLPVSRSENLEDATNNLDSFVEIHATLKSHAVNLEKISNDIRLLSSDLMGNNEIIIPKKQIGSSIMPGKVNPVIIEYVISAVHKIYSNDSLISSLCGMGCLDLNAYIPSIGHALLESLKLLISANKTLTENLFTGMIVNAGIAENKLYKSPAISTVLIPYIGYNKATKISNLMKTEYLDIFEANSKLNFISESKIKTIMKTQNLLKTGYSINDLDE